MAKLNCKNQTVFVGDNREVMLGLNSGCIDLICADSPFNKEKRFDHVFGSPKQQKKKKKPGFDDKWDGWLMTPQRAEELTLLEKCHPHIFRLCNAALEMHSAGMQGYLVMMSTRLIECHRLLAATGSIYLHCDPTANAYLRLLMDGIFGKQNFRNQIVWKRQTNSGAKAKSKRKFGAMFDTILFYAKSEAHKINHLYLPVTKDYIERNFKMQDERGRFKTEEIQESSKAKMEEYERNGLLYRTSTGRLRKKKYEWQFPGELIGSLWTDFMALGSNATERSGWSTQKPVALYSRMILASSNPGDVVLDPFCGCATTLVAAENAGRKWIGIDRDEEAERQVVLQLNKLNQGTETEAQDELGKDWGRRVIIRHCDNKRKEHPVRDDLGEFEHYKKHFDRLYTEQAGICAGCDHHYDAKVMHVDHDFPRAKGGQDNIENLQVLCSGCNSRKGTGTLSQLREKNRRLGLMKPEKKREEASAAHSFGE